ncbi:MAG TPA: hypothetical protein VKS78_10105 [Roseiarcus sp.]|nr:hypothetical protein [Roseiarcus sp.]
MIVNRGYASSALDDFAQSAVLTFVDYDATKLDGAVMNVDAQQSLYSTDFRINLIENCCSYFAVGRRHLRIGDDQKVSKRPKERVQDWNSTHMRPQHERDCIGDRRVDMDFDRLTRRLRACFHDRPPSNFNNSRRSSETTLIEVNFKNDAALARATRYSSKGGDRTSPALLESKGTEA